MPPPPPPYSPPPPPPPPPPPGGGGGYVPPPSGGYQQPPPAYQPYGYAAQRNDGLAIASLVLGILSIICSLGCLGLILGPAAAIMGFISRQRIATSGGAVGGGTLALIGLILGILGFVISVAVFFFVVVSGMSGAFSSPTPS